MSKMMPDLSRVIFAFIVFISLGIEKIDSKCVVSVGEYEYCLGKRKNIFKWEVVGETEIARGNLSPQFENTIEIQYDMSKSRLLRFDLFGSSSVVTRRNYMLLQLSNSM
jgi:hypothetical protein